MAGHQAVSRYQAVIAVRFRRIQASLKGLFVPLLGIARKGVLVIADLMVGAGLTAGPPAS